jgi:hypothetical protein
MSEISDDFKMKLFNIAKDEILNALVKEKILDKTDAEEFDMRRQFVLYKPKWYEKYWNKIGGSKDKLDNQYVKLVEFLDRDETLDVLTNEN